MFCYRDDDLAVEADELVTSSTSRTLITRSWSQVEAWTRFDV